jgi:hypothetical protein
MKKNVLLISGIICTAAFVYGQSTSVTNNNTVVIHGNVYYFKPSTTPSSPQPKVGSSNFISYGRWYGADAAKAWASIADWAIEHCEYAYPAVKGDDRTTVYISSVEARKSYTYNHEICIYYWVVRKGDRMEDGHRATRSFYFY